MLDGVSEDIAQFLMRTSILQRMCGPLCDAVLGESGSDLRLEQLEEAQLFLLPLDDRRIWYRYHALFAQFLIRELGRRSGMHQAELHRRASGWLRAQNLVVEASDHGIAAGDLADAAQLIGHTYLDCITTGSLEHVIGWLDQIPDSVVQASPEACIARAQTLAFSNRLDKVEPWLRAAIKAAANGRPLAGHFGSVEVAANHVRSTVSYFRGDTRSAATWARTGAELAMQLGATVAGEVYIAAYVRGAVAYRNGDLDSAERAFQRDIERGQLRGRPQLEVTALSYATLVALQRRDIGGARRLFAIAVDAARRLAFTQPWIATLLAIGAGRLALLGGAAETAQRELSAVIDHARKGPDRLALAELLINLAEAERRLGRNADAQSHLADALGVVETCPAPGSVLEAWRDHADATTTSTQSTLGLTSRQVEVLQLLARGLPSSAIARELRVSERTVHAHLRTIYRKLGVTSRTGATRLAIERGIAS